MPLVKCVTLKLERVSQLRIVPPTPIVVPMKSVIRRLGNVNPPVAAPRVALRDGARLAPAR